MVTVPIVQSRARLQTGPANVPINAGVVRGIATDSTGAGDALIRAGAQLMERQAALEERQQRARDTIESVKATTAATKTLNDAAYEIEQSGDWQNGGKTFDAKAAGLSSLGAGIKDPVRKAQLDAHIQALTESHRVTLRQKLFKLEADDGIAALDDNLDTLSKAAATAPNDAARMETEIAAAANIKAMVDARYITQKQGIDLHQKFKGRMDQVQVERLIQRDPLGAERALADPRFAPNLDPVQREKAASRAGVLVDRIERRKIADEDRNERRADRMIAEQGKVVSKELWSMWNPDPNKSRLTEDGVERYKTYLPVDEYKALRRAALGEGREVRDNPGSVARLEPLLGQPGAQKLVDQAVNAGELSTGTYRSMRERADRLQAENGPAKPYAAGRQYLVDTLDPGQMGSDPYVRQALASARQQALADYDTHIEQNPTIARPDAVNFADQLKRQYQNVAFDQMRIALPRPAGYTGSKSDVRIEDVDAARRKIQAEIDAKRLSPEQAVLQLNQLDTWEQIIATAAAKAAAAPSKPGTKKP